MSSRSTPMPSVQRSCRCSQPLRACRWYAAGYARSQPSDTNRQTRPVLGLSPSLSLLSRCRALLMPPRRALPAVASRCLDRSSPQQASPSMCKWSCQLMPTPTASQAHSAPPRRPPSPPPSACRCRAPLLPQSPSYPSTRPLRRRHHPPTRHLLPRPHLHPFRHHRRRQPRPRGG